MNFFITPFNNESYHVLHNFEKSLKYSELVFTSCLYYKQEDVDPNYTLSLITKTASLIVSKNNSIPLQSLETLYLYL